MPKAVGTWLIIGGIVLVVVGGDDLLTGGFVQLADTVELQVLRVVEDLGNHFA